MASILCKIFSKILLKVIGNDKVNISFIFKINFSGENIGTTHMFLGLDIFLIQKMQEAASPTTSPRTANEILKLKFNLVHIIKIINTENTRKHCSIIWDKEGILVCFNPK